MVPNHRQESRLTGAMPFVYLGTDDYEQLGGAYRPIIQAFELGDDGIALTPKEDSDLCKKSRASSFAPPHPPVTCARR